MQWTVFMLSSAVLVTARTRNENKDEFGLGSVNSRDLYRDYERLWNPRYQKNLYQMFNAMNENSGSSSGLQSKKFTGLICEIGPMICTYSQYNSGDLKILRKRALSALSRWKPLGSLGIRVKQSHRVPSRAPMMSMVPEMNLISAETGDGVRPLGQPLRWGRKR